MKPRIAADGERLAGRYPWLFTCLYIACIVIGCRLLETVSGEHVGITTVLAIAALGMAVEARFGGRLND